MKRIIPVIVLAILLMSGAAYAADATAALDMNSAYVWRGITFNDGLVAQPSMDVTKGGFGFNVWGNFDIADYNETLDANNFSEVDLTVSYGFSVAKLDVGVGLIEYLFPAGGAGTREAYVSLSHPIIAGLSAGVDFYYDVDEVHGYYTDLVLSYGMDLGEKLSIEVAGKAAYANDEYATAYGGLEGGFYDYNISLGVGYAVSDALSLAATINYTDTLDKDVLPEALVDTNVYGGVNISYAF